MNRWRVTFTNGSVACVNADTHAAGFARAARTSSKKIVSCVLITDADADRARAVTAFNNLKGTP